MYYNWFGIEYNDYFQTNLIRCEKRFPRAMLSVHDWLPNTHKLLPSYTKMLFIHFHARQIWTFSAPPPPPRSSHDHHFYGATTSSFTRLNMKTKCVWHILINLRVNFHNDRTLWTVVLIVKNCRWGKKEKEPTNCYDLAFFLSPICEFLHLKYFFTLAGLFKKSLSFCSIPGVSSGFKVIWADFLQLIRDSTKVFTIRYYLREKSCAKNSLSTMRIFMSDSIPVSHPPREITK